MIYCRFLFLFLQPGTPLETPPSNMTNKWKSIEDIASADDVESLSNIELKKILTVNFVDYKGCVEKSELIEKVKRLWNSQNLSQKGRFLDYMGYIAALFYPLLLSPLSNELFPSKLPSQNFE